MADKSKTERAPRKTRPANFKLKTCLISLIRQDEYSESDLSLMTSLFENVTQQKAA